MVWSQVVRIPRIPYPFSSFWVRPAIRRSDPTPWLSQPFVPLPRSVRWMVGEGIRPYRSVLHPTIASSDWQVVRPSPPSWRLSANGPPQRIDPVSTVHFLCPPFGRDPTGTPGGTPAREWHEWPEWKDRIEVSTIRLGHPLSVDWRADGSVVCPSVHGSHGGWLRSLSHIPRSIASRTDGVAAIAIFFCRMAEASLVSFSPRCFSC